MKTLEPNAFSTTQIPIADDYLIQFDNLKLQCVRLGQEWQIEYAYKAKQSDTDELTEEIYQAPSGQRCIVNANSPALTLQLRLANRPVVSRPQEKLFLAPKASATLYLFSTLWVCISQENSVLLELPGQVLSDIWFGPNTRSGELAYSNPLKVSLEPPEADIKPEKALTALTIENNGAEQLPLEKINLPVPELKLYRCDNRYQTDDVEIVVSKDNEARLAIKPIDSDKSSTLLLSEARKVVSWRTLNRAVDVLLG